MKWWTIRIFLAVLLVSPSPPTFAAETPLKTITVAVPAVSLLQAPLFVAIDAGAFKKYGMDVRYVLTGARTIQALIGGSVQFAQGVSSRTVPSAVLGGADAILIANFVDKFLFTMHSAPEINSMQDLKGKVVGVSGIGGSTDFATRVALRERACPRQGRSDSRRGRNRRDRGGHESKGRPCGHALTAVLVRGAEGRVQDVVRHDKLGRRLCLVGSRGQKGVDRLQPSRGETVSHGDDRGGEDFENRRGVFPPRADQTYQDL